jgi:hypothetical protein
MCFCNRQPQKKMLEYFPVSYRISEEIGRRVINEQRLLTYGDLRKYLVIYEEFVTEG